MCHDLFDIYIVNNYDKRKRIFRPSDITYV